MLFSPCLFGISVSHENGLDGIVDGLVYIIFTLRQFFSSKYLIKVFIKPSFISQQVLSKVVIRRQVHGKGVASIGFFLQRTT